MSDAALEGFRPVRWLPGRHLQTIVPALWSLPPLPGADGSYTVPVDEGTAVRVDVNRPSGAARGTLLLTHGMGGSSDSGYLRRTARFALSRGWATARMNLRNCGGTAALSRTLYNAGQSSDVESVLGSFRDANLPEPYAAVGFSLGGNLLLRYAGIAGEHCRAVAVAAVNPPVDLDACVRELERPANRLYQAYYVRSLREQVRSIRAARSLPASFPSERRVRTVRGFDELFTAPDGGYPSAEAYYDEASSARHLSGMARPTLILSARNDPFVPPAMFDAHRRNTAIRFLLPRRGGHCGYWQSGRPRYWAAEAIVGFVSSAGAHAGTR